MVEGLYGLMLGNMIEILISIFLKKNVVKFGGQTFAQKRGHFALQAADPASNRAFEPSRSDS